MQKAKQSQTFEGMTNKINLSARELVSETNS